MKKWIFGFIILALLVGGYLMNIDGQLRGAVASEVLPEAPVVIAPVEESGLITAEAIVVPAKSVSLSPPMSGRVAEVLVNENDWVEAGQILLQVENAQQKAELGNAQAKLQHAQAKLAELTAGPRTEEVAAAQAEVASAQAKLAKLEQTKQPEEVIAAEAKVTAAKASLNNLYVGPDENEMKVAAAELRRNEVAVQQAQWAFDQISYSNDANTTPQAAQLQQATIDYEAALANFNLVNKEPTWAEIATAQADVAVAEAELVKLQQESLDADIAAAKADIQRAQAELDLLAAGSRPEVIAAAEADVTAMEADLVQAEIALANTTIRAPFSGVVAGLDINAGEQIMAGTPIIELADLSAWQIKTEDLTEFSAVKLQIGNFATLTFDAIPDLLLEGTISHIDIIGEDKFGDVTYVATIQIDTYDDRLLWNMSAFVTIDPEGEAAITEQ